MINVEIVEVIQVTFSFVELYPRTECYNQSHNRKEDFEWSFELNRTEKLLYVQNQTTKNEAETK